MAWIRSYSFAHASRETAYDRSDLLDEKRYKICSWIVGFRPNNATGYRSCAMRIHRSGFPASLWPMERV